MCIPWDDKSPSITSQFFSSSSSFELSQVECWLVRFPWPPLVLFMQYADAYILLPSQLHFIPTAYTQFSLYCS